MLGRSRLIAIIVFGLLVLSILPAPIAERYTSPTQDGQYLFSPARSYGFVLALARTGDSAVLGSSGKALAKAKSVFTDDRTYPSKVELLYLPDRRTYTYASLSGQILTILDPPDFVWEIWGPAPQPDVVGFLDYVSAERLGLLGTPSP